MIFLYYEIIFFNLYNRLKKENTAEIHLVRNEVQSMKEKMRIAREKLQKIESIKAELAIRIKETACKRMNAELGLRTKQKSLAAVGLKSEKERNQMAVSETKIIHQLEGQVRLFTNQLRMLEDEKLILAQDMKTAEDYLTQTRYFWRFLEVELEKLKLK